MGAFNPQLLGGRDAAMMSMRRAIAGKRPEEIRNMSKTDVLHPISQVTRHASRVTRHASHPTPQEDFESALGKISRSVGKTDIDKCVTACESHIGVFEGARQSFDDKSEL